MTKPATVRPLRADARANRDALLTAARALFMERGASDVPLEDIAQRAGVGRATVYRHFPTRGDLLLGLLDQLVDELEGTGAALPDSPDSFMKLFRAAVKLQVENLPLVDLLPPRSELPPGVDALRERLHQLYRRPLATAQAAGAVNAELSPQDIRVLVSMLSAVVRHRTPEADRRRAMRLVTRMLEP